MVFARCCCSDSCRAPFPHAAQFTVPVGTVETVQSPPHQNGQRRRRGEHTQPNRDPGHHRIDACIRGRGRRTHRSPVGVHPDVDTVTGFDKVFPGQGFGVFCCCCMPLDADGVSKAVHDGGAVLENGRGDRMPRLCLFGIRQTVRFGTRRCRRPPRPERRWLRPRLPGPRAPPPLGHLGAQADCDRIPGQPTSASAEG